MIHDPDDEMVVISAEGVGRGVLRGNTITMIPRTCPHGHGPLQPLRGNDGHAVVKAPDSYLRNAPIVERRVYATVWACNVCEYAEVPS